MWQEWLVRQEQCKDIIRQAETWRRWRAALAETNPRNRLYRRALDRLGRWLVAWGRRLQTKDAAAVSAAKPRVVSETS